MSKDQPPVKLAVIASAPNGDHVAFEVSGWRAEYRLRQKLASYPLENYGWAWVNTHRLVSQREAQ